MFPCSLAFDQICLAEAPPAVHEETGPSEANIFAGKSIVSPEQAPKKHVKPVCQLQKILIFKLLTEAQTDSSIEQSNTKPN